MFEPALVVRVERDANGTAVALAPAVGVWTDPPAPGLPVGPGSTVGRLQVLTRRFRLLLPDGPTGAVERAGRGGAIAVEYGQVLFTIREGPVATTESRGGVGLGRSDDLPPGTLALCSPTDGQFYRRPSPDAPPFVEVGSRVVRGEPIGLVEVMKTFNHVAYGGPGLPEEAQVVEIRCEDGAEVRTGQILLLVR